MILGAKIEIGGTVWSLTPAQYEAYTAADSAFNKARVARDKALGEPERYPKGICNFWILNVRLTHDGNEFIPAETEGDLNVIETSASGNRVLKGLFYPAGKSGFGEVTWPRFERIGR